MPEQTLGQVLGAARHDRGLGLEELSEMTGRSVSYLSYLELDEIVPTKDRLRDISRALGLAPETIEALRVLAVADSAPPQSPPA